MGLSASPVAARLAGAAPAMGPGEFLIDLLLGAVLFVVVIAVTAVVMTILQAVLPHGDTEADALAERERADDEAAEAGAAGERDAELYAEHPMTDEELALADDPEAWSTTGPW